MNSEEQWGRKLSEKARRGIQIKWEAEKRRMAGEILRRKWAADGGTVIINMELPRAHG